MAKKKSKLTIGKDNNAKAAKIREQNRLNNLRYREKLKTDPLKKKQNEKRLEDAKHRSKERTKYERTLRGKYSNFREISRQIWRTRKQAEADRKNDLENKKITVEWETFAASELDKQSRPESQSKRRKKERKVMALKLKESNDMNVELKKKVKVLQMQMNRLKQKETTASVEKKQCSAELVNKTLATMPSNPDQFGKYFPNCICIANYGESSEFKNICDGMGDHVKTPLKSAITRGDLVLDSARSVYDYLCQHMAYEPENDQGRKMHRRSFYFVASKDIQRDERSAKPVPGLLSTHSIVGIKHGFVGLRKISCYCHSCLQDWNTPSCQNIEYVDQWRVSHVRNNM